MLIGYSILYVDDDITIKDVLWKRRTVYTWEKALSKAQELVKEKTEDYADEDELSVLSFIKENSKENCDKYGQTVLYELKTGYSYDTIYAVPVYDE